MATALLMMSQIVEMPSTRNLQASYMLHISLQRSSSFEAFWTIHHRRFPPVW